MTEFVHVGRHADILASGRSLGPSDRCTDKQLDLDHKSGDEIVPGEDQHLIEEGVLVDVAEFGETPAKTAAAKKEGS